MPTPTVDPRLAGLAENVRAMLAGLDALDDTTSRLDDTPFRRRVETSLKFTRWLLDDLAEDVDARAAGR